MTKEEKKQKSVSQENNGLEKSVNNVESNNNRALLWAIFSALVILIGLVVVVMVINILHPTKSTEISKQERIGDENNSSKSNISTDQKSEEDTVAKPSVVPVQNVESDKPLPKKSCKAEDFDDKKYDDGESYTTKEGCETCECNDGKWNCQVKDSCIILPSDCIFDDRIYHDKETRNADCDQTCTCDDHHWKCEMDSSSSCCKAADGKIYHNGESFPKDCNTCTCNNGSINCTMMLCL
jgi:hypothetical protein